MQLEFESYLKDKFPYLLTESSVLCCSGGVDSVVLFHLMLSVSKNFVVAHCNFNLRDNESFGDLEFVKDLCEKNSIKFYSKSFNTKKIQNTSNNSIQMVARDLRYDFFENLSVKLNINHILTAHHLNDSLESFIINISRGSGLDGLTGIPELNKKIKRPLIEFEKVNIINYAKSNNLKWREDSSNKSNSYLRNKIRNKIIPELEKLDGNFLKNFKKSISYLKISNSVIHEKIDELKTDLIDYNRNEIRIKISNFDKVNKEVFLYYFLRDFGFTDWDTIFNLSDSESGKKILSESHILCKSKEFLILRPIHEIKKINQIIVDDSSIVEINNGKHVKFTISNEISRNNNNIITIDRDKLKFPLLLRNLNKGDSFQPFGMKGSKKVSKYLKDKNISQIDKGSVIVLVNGDDNIIWIVGMRLDNRFCVSENSQKLLNIEYY